jgi:hypothetical protein
MTSENLNQCLVEAESALREEYDGYTSSVQLFENDGPSGLRLMFSTGLFIQDRNQIVTPLLSTSLDTQILATKALNRLERALCGVRARTVVVEELPAAMKRVQEFTAMLARRKERAGHDSV